jgi:hypothetical protein
MGWWWGEDKRQSDSHSLHRHRPGLSHVCHFMSMTFLFSLELWKNEMHLFNYFDDYVRLSEDYH